jgi:death-on-curing protein
MQEKMGQGGFGILSESALRSALTRPINAARYENADGIRQAAFLYHGLTSAHGFTDGNKRIAFLALAWFMKRNNLGNIKADMPELIQFGLDAAAGKSDVDAVEDWLRNHSQ